MSRAGVALLCIAIGATAVRAAAAAEPTLAEESAFRAAVERVASAVVRVEPLAAPEPASGGSSEAHPGSGPSTGLVVRGDAEASWIVATSFAVPQEVAEAVIVLGDGTRLAARVVGRDRSRSLVLLKAGPIAGAAALEPAPRGDLAPGQWTIAVGRGWGHAAPGVSVGILSAVNRCWGKAVQTDAAVSPANYGGPLIDIAGRVIGILAPLPIDTAGMPQGTELYDAGIGFAVPLEDILRVLPRLERGETLAPGLLGITWRSADEITGPPDIASCRQGSPANQAGLRAGDRIVRFAGREVGRIADVRHQIAPRYAGDEVEIVVERRGGDGQEPGRATLRATLVEALPPWRRAVIGLLPAPAAKDAAGPVKVAAVLPAGPAARGGVVAGDLIGSIALATGGGAAERTPIESPAALAGFLAGVEPGDTVEVGFERDGKQAMATIVTESMPVEVPDPVLPEPQVEGDPLAAAIDAATIVKLEGPEETRPTLAVLPRAAGEPLAGVLVYFGPPRGAIAEAEAGAWKAAAAKHGVAVILPGSGDPQRWSTDDLPRVRRALAALNAKRPIDPARVAVAGRGAGGSFAWLVADRLGGLVRGAALIDAALPRQAKIEAVDPGRWRWVLLGVSGNDTGKGPRSPTTVRQSLEAAGFPVGAIVADGDGPPTDLLCRWVSMLNLL